MRKMATTEEELQRRGGTLRVISGLFYYFVSPLDSMEIYISHQ